MKIKDYLFSEAGNGCAPVAYDGSVIEATIDSVFDRCAEPVVFNAKHVGIGGCCRKPYNDVSVNAPAIKSRGGGYRGK